MTLLTICSRRSCRSRYQSSVIFGEPYDAQDDCWNQTTMAMYCDVIQPRSSSTGHRCQLVETA
jgi:hypothetical protein